MPNHGFTPMGVMASSVRFALPTMRASAARAPARQAASRAAGVATSATARQPAVVGTPATSMRSLTARRGPVPDPPMAVMKVDISAGQPVSTGVCVTGAAGAAAT